jgi:DNA mismatch repair protein MutS2
MLRPNVKELLRGFAFLADIEFIRAKAHLADRIQGITPEISDAPVIDWVQARHPLLEINLTKQGKKVIPLDLQLHRKQRILIISGPNAGGKSVCLKTVGLLQYMFQCGIPVPMRENSRIGIFQHLFIDIGDEQSIEDDLSTYSSHLLNMKNMMRSANPSSLLLIDEFGSGTEPTIGGAFAESVLKRYVQRGAFGVITTHYQNLKHYAENTPGVVNGAMLYDRQHMQALFQLQIGNPGSSFAVEIARKIGIPEEVIADATELVGREYVNADKYLLDITRDKRYWEGKRQTIHTQEKQMVQTIEKYEREITELQQKRKEIIREAKAQADQIIREANARVENTIREIREAQAEKERTRDVRQQLEEFRERLEEEQKHERNEMIERKMQQIEQRHKRKEERKRKKSEEKDKQTSAVKPTPKQEIPLEAGDHCRIKGQTSVGVIERVDGQKATVTFGMMKTVVDYKRLERASVKEKQETSPTVNFLSRETQNQVRKKHLEFSQEIDVRGMRGDEALQAVSYFMDDALMVSARQVRILHGTGNGILRQLIRQYLSTLPFVRNARDEHVQFGGAGITVVEMK